MRPLLQELALLREEFESAALDFLCDWKYGNDYGFLPGAALSEEALDPLFPVPEAVYQEQEWGQAVQLRKIQAEETEEKSDPQNPQPNTQNMQHSHRPFTHNLYGDFEVKRVPRYQLGYHVLGRAFPYRGLVEIASDLYGEEFQEVLLHETLHMKHPEKPEGEIRRMTRELLPFGTKRN